MSDKPTAKGGSAIRVNIAADRLSADLLIDPVQAPVGLPQSDVLLAIGHAGIAVSPVTQKAIASATNPAGCVITPQPLVIANGAAPINDKPGKIELLMGGSAEDNTANFYERSAVQCVKVDDVVARICPMKPGQDGLDVCGKAIRRRILPSFRPRLGANVVLGKDGVSIIATASGQVKLDVDKIQVDPILAVRGDVDFSSGNINFAGIVTISGSVKDLFKVHAGGNIEIHQAVEAAEVVGGADVIINGAVVGKEKGAVTAAGNLSCKFASNAKFIVGKDMVVQGELNNCQVASRGQFTGQRGPVLGGRVTANKGVNCHTIGSPSQVSTIIEAGMDDQLRAQCAQQLPEIELQLKKVAKVRQTIEPLLRNQKNLTAAQKEKATELLYEADEVEKTAREVSASLKSNYEQVARESKAEIIVQHMVHPGVTIRFPQAETVIDKEIKGPLTFQPAKVNHEWRVVIRRADGRVIPLASKGVADATLKLLAQMFGAAPAQPAPGQPASPQPAAGSSPATVTAGSTASAGAAPAPATTGSAAA